MKKLFDFTQQAPDVGWSTEDDGVMGGESDSRLCQTGQGAAFEGTVSTKNFGGFCYVRSPLEVSDLSDHSGFEIEAKSSGTAFRLLAYTTDRSKSYRSQLLRPGEEFETLTVPFGDLYPYFWGWKNPFAKAFDPAKIEEIGFQTEYKATGDFQIVFKTISAV